MKVWTVYEIVNEALRQAYLAATPSDLLTELRRIRQGPPAAIAAWPLDIRRSVLVLEVVDSAFEAAAVMTRRQRGLSLLGFRVTRETQGGSEEPSEGDSRPYGSSRRN